VLGFSPVASAVLFALGTGLAVLILTMRPAARTTPAARPDYEAARAQNPAEARP
jgi:DHA2 family multidrug resistance protein-like MFS transporter